MISTHIMEYGAEAPTKGGEFITAETKGGRTYRNEVTSAARLSNQAYQNFISQEIPGIERLFRRMRRLGHIISLANQKMQRIKVDTPEGKSGLPRHLRGEHPEAVKLQAKITQAKTKRSEIKEETKRLRSEWEARVIAPVQERFKDAVAFATLQKAASGDYKSSEEARRILAQEWAGRHALPKGEKKRRTKAEKQQQMSEQTYDALLRRAEGTLGPNVRGPAVEDPLRQEWLDDPAVPEQWKFKARADQFRKDVEKEAYEASGVSWGTRDTVSRAFMASLQKTPFPKFVDSSHPIRIGRKVNQPVSTLWSGTGVLKFTMLEVVGRRKKGKNSTPTGVIQNPRKVVEVRFNLDRDREVRIPVLLDRDLPEDGVISDFHIKITKKQGCKPTYKAQFTIEADFDRQTPATDKVLAINLGWRRLENFAVQVATTWDGERVGHLVLPGTYFLGVEKKEFLLSVKEMRFNDAKRLVSDFVKEQGQGYDHLRDLLKEAGQDLPEWLHLSALPNWRKAGKLAILTKAMRQAWAPNYAELWRNWLRHCGVSSRKRSNRQPKCDLLPTLKDATGKELTNFAAIQAWFAAQGVTDPKAQLALALEWWRQKDEHLMAYARGLEQRLTFQRRDIYRKQAFQWSREYAKVVVEQWDKSKTAKRNKTNPKAPTQQDDASSALRQQIGISVLVSALKEKFLGDFNQERAEKITIEHFGCGGVGVGAREHRMVPCSRCERLYDQDVNAAKHLLDRFERSNGKPSPGGARNSQEAVAAE